MLWCILLISLLTRNSLKAVLRTRRVQAGSWPSLYQVPEYIWGKIAAMIMVVVQTGTKSKSKRVKACRLGQLVLNACVWNTCLVFVNDM